MNQIVIQIMASLNELKMTHKFWQERGFTFDFNEHLWVSL
jgi:hypothetical protein